MLIGSLVVAALIATLGSRPRERDSAIGAILAFGMGIGILLLGYYRGFATAATNILFGDIFGVSGSQLLILVIICLIVVAVMGTWYRPLLFASVDPEAAEARGVPVRRLGLVFLLVLALTVTGAAQVVGTLLVLAGQLRRQQRQGQRVHHQHQLRNLPRRPPRRAAAARPQPRGPRSTCPGPGGPAPVTPCRRRVGAPLAGGAPLGGAPQRGPAGGSCPGSAGPAIPPFVMRPGAGTARPRAASPDPRGSP